MRGFKLPPEAIESSSEILIPPSTKTESLDVKYKDQTERIQPLLKRIHKRFSCVLDWNQSDTIVVLTSSIAAGSQRVIDYFFTGCTHFVAEKSFILWLIDDQNQLDEDYLKQLIERAQEMSKGLKHPFIFQYTPSSKIKSLLTFLLSDADKQR